VVENLKTASPERKFDDQFIQASEVKSTLES